MLITKKWKLEEPIINPVSLINIEGRTDLSAIYLPIGLLAIGLPIDLSASCKVVTMANDECTKWFKI